MFSCVRALSQKPPQTKTQSQDSASQVNGVNINCMYVRMYVLELCACIYYLYRNPSTSSRNQKKAVQVIMQQQ